MANFSDRPEPRNIGILGEVDPTLAGTGDEADQQALRQFLPLEIGRILRSLGHHVTVVSETGQPTAEAAATGDIVEPWMDGVDWVDGREPGGADASSEDSHGLDLQTFDLAVVSLAGWLPTLGTVRGNIDDPVVQAMTALADTLADSGVERVVFVDVDAPDDDTHDLRRNTRGQIASLLRDDSSFGDHATQLSFVVGTGPIWSQRDDFTEAETDEEMASLIDEGEARTDSADHGDRLEAIAVAAVRTAIDAEYRPHVDGTDIVGLGHSAFARTGGR